MALLSSLVILVPVFIIIVTLSMLVGFTVLGIAIYKLVFKFIATSGDKVTDGIAGILQVTATSYPAVHARYANCRLTGVVLVPGKPAVPFSRHIIAKTSKWPQPGMNIPVLVDRTNPERVQILWDKVPEGNDVAKQQAQQMADAINKRPSQ